MTERILTPWVLPPMPCTRPDEFGEVVPAKAYWDLRELATKMQSALSEKKEPPCETCNDEPAVCATVPGLRHCEAAQRSAIEAHDLAEQELRNIIQAERFNLERFRDDTEFADWAQSRCRWTLEKIK